MSTRRLTFIDEMDLLIDTANEECRADDLRNKGWINSDIVAKMRKRGQELLKGHYDEMADDVMARRVSQRLGRSRDIVSAFSEPLLPDLNLAEYFSIPAPDGVAGGPRWKRDVDVTVDELWRIIVSRRQFVTGHNFETQKYVVLHTTAVRRGGKGGDRLGAALKR